MHYVTLEIRQPYYNAVGRNAVERNFMWLRFKQNIKAHGPLVSFRPKFVWQVATVNTGEGGNTRDPHSTASLAMIVSLEVR